MPANLEHSAVATGLEEVSFHSNPKEEQCQRMFKLLYNCAHFIWQQGYAQNPSSQASVVCEPRISRVQAGFRTRGQIANICWIIEKAKEFQKNIYFCSIGYAKAFDCVNHNKLRKILIEKGIPDHLTCFLRNLFVDQEAAVRESYLEKLTGSKLGKDSVKAVYGYPVYLTYTQRAKCSAE